ncbi:MAG: hypothetical protein H6858_04135 [Rhodospirillales bacterium]|nr:hypothetical protein [Alphaproteobacteria bacterium]MCB9976776.1 hypothetical protein [Rhodospirillales bacterium]
MILGQRLKLLSLIFVGTVFSAPTFACGGEGKYELHLKKKDVSAERCVPLLLEYPEIVEGFKQVDARLTYDDGNDHFLSVDLEVDDLDQKDGILTTDLCLAEDMLRHTSIQIEWYHHVQREDGLVEMTFCHVDVDTGDLYSLLQSGGTKEIDPNHYIP